ncbi:unnamed protein product [Prorocentrum cordatum]|uniref:Uncharacterized protein n=1 Tax=Prorocentrum cordatum TaxID=2364126 RepID=A0ABN9UCR8_9DINO|nr:unnamed protein product [Polarella glacialis]
MATLLTKEEQQILEDQLFGLQTPSCDRERCDDEGSERLDDGHSDCAKQRTCIRCNVTLLVGNEPGTPVNAVCPSSSDRTVCQDCAELKQLVSTPLEGPLGAVRFPSDSDKEFWPKVVDCYRTLRNVCADGDSTVPLEELAIQWADAATKLAGRYGEIDVSGGHPECPGQAASGPPASEPTRADEVHGSGLANGGGVKQELETPHPELSPVMETSCRSGFSRTKGMQTNGPDSTVAELGNVEPEPADQSEDESSKSAVNKFSVDERLPKGQLFISIGRIRATINSYVECTGSLGWLPDFKVQTVQALERRLNQHKAEIEEQANVDIKVAFSQLSVRVSSLIQMFKLFKAWFDENADTALVPILEKMSKLNPYMEHKGLQVAADLQIIIKYATFYKNLGDGKSIYDAMEEFDFTHLVECYNAVSQNVDKLTGTVESKTVVVKDEDGADDAADTRAAKPTAAKRRKLFVLPRDLISRRVSARPLEQFEKLVSDSLAKYIFNIDSEAVKRMESQVVTGTVETVTKILEVWEAKVGMNTAEDKFRDLLNAVVCITRCAMKDERERPSVNAARWARKIVITMAKEESPGAELAKALVAHRAGEEFMTFALAHAKAGLEDEAASNGFDVSLEIFEHDLEPIFDDAVSFLRSGNNGKAVTVESFTPYLESCQKMAVACQQALQRWSPSALETNTESLANTISNMYMLLHTGNFVYTDTVKGWAGSLLMKAVEASKADVVSTGENGAGTEVVQGQSAKTHGKDAEAMAIFASKNNLYSYVREIDSNVRAMRPRLKAFVDSMLQLALNAQKLYRVAASRVGSAWHEKFDKESSGESVLKNFNHNVSVIDKMISYLQDLFLLADPDWWLDGEKVSESTPKADENTLCNFSRVHHEHTCVKPFFLKVASVIQVPDNGDDVAHMFGQFCKYVGQRMYDLKTTAFLKSKMEHISETEVRLGIVHGDVIQDCEAICAYSHLVPKADSKDIVDLASIDFARGRGDLATLSQLNHNMAYDHLERFTKAVVLTHLEVPGVTNADPNITKPSVEDAMFILSLKCAVADVVATVAAADVNIIKKGSSGDNTFNKTFICQDATYIMQVLHGALTKLDGIINNTVAVNFEKKGWQFGEPIASIRHWCSLAGAFSTKCEGIILNAMAAILTKHTEDTAKATPTWSACISDDNFNETMATQMLKNKLQPLVSSHNSLHDTLKDFADAAGLLAICPRVQDNDITSEAVAVAQTTMRKATEASVIIQGVELLFVFRHRPEGPDKAKAFLAERQPLHPTLPRAFWQQFSDLHAHAVSPSTSPFKAPGAPPPASVTSVATKTPAKSEGSPLEELVTPAPKKYQHGSESSGSACGKVKGSSSSALPSKGFKRAKRI